MKLDIIKKTAGNKLTLELAGSFDAVTSQKFDEEFALAVPGKTDVTLEFSGVEYLSSAGLRSILIAKKLTAGGGGTFKVVNPRPVIMEVFHVAKFTNLIEIVEGTPEEGTESGFDGFYPLRPIQRWLVDTHFQKANSTMMNIGGLAKLDDSVDLERLAGALNGVISAYDIFRCRLVFHPDTGEICQRFDGEIAKVRVETMSAEAFAERKRELKLPFQLIDRPLYRVYLMETDTGKYIYLDFYHAILDGTAFGLLFWREMDMRYQGKSIKREPSSYAEYVLSEAQNRGAGQEEGHRYWREMLEGFDPDRHLPPADVREEGIWQEGVCQRKMQNINAGYFRQAKQNENAFLMAAAMLAIAKTTGSGDAVISWVHNGRITPKERRLMGLMLNQLPLRWQFGENETAAELLGGLEAKIKEGLGYASALDEVYDKDLEGECATFILQKGTDSSSVFTLNGLPVIQQEMPDNKISAAENVLDINMVAGADGSYNLLLRYDARRYSPQAMERYAALVDEMLLALQDGGRRIAEILR